MFCNVLLKGVNMNTRTQQNNSSIKIELDAELIIENLQLKGFCECDRMPTSEIKQALSKWIQILISDIHADPDWFIKNNNFAKFKALLPEPFLFDEIQNLNEFEIIDEFETIDEFVEVLEIQNR